MAQIRVPTDLAPWVELRDLTREEIASRFGIGPDGTADGVKYQGIAPVTRLSNLSRFPGHFFFEPGAATPAMVYIGDRDTLGPLDPDELMQALGGEGATLRSRAGKHVVQHVYPEAGIAFAAERDEVKLIEIFPPTTQEYYEAEIHKDPGPFTR
jgi:hypothetical protein